LRQNRKRSAARLQVTAKTLSKSLLLMLELVVIQTPHTSGFGRDCRVLSQTGLATVTIAIAGLG
jgi:hypothetical protein